MTASRESQQTPKQIVIVGGGTAGWLTAAYLARILATRHPGGVAITVIESPEIAIIGVGEGSFPTIRNSLRALGIDEKRFLRGAAATFKQGIRFDHWREAGSGSYFHPFSVPLTLQGAELLPYWLLDGAGGTRSFVESTGVQAQVVDARRAPKRLTDPDYDGGLTYAYHFDAAKLAGLLRDVAKELGVRHLSGTISAVDLAEDGSIARLTSADHGTLTADLYIDCSGFRAELIGRALGEPLRSCHDQLLTDRAIAIQAPYQQPDAPIASATISTAHEAGWSWDIGLAERRGVGYVYSSAHSDDDRAEQVLRRHIGRAADGLAARRIRFETGFRRRQWIGNCVAVGLSAGFFEPLESTGIMLIEVAAHLIAELFPWNGEFAPVARRYNHLMLERHERIVDFLKLHYCLSERPEPFWRDNRSPESLPDSLKDKLAMWQTRPPSRFDFTADTETFLPCSYQAVLYGMGFKTDLGAARGTYRAGQAARRRFAEIAAMVPRALAELPPHRDLINQIYQHNQCVTA